MRKKTILVSGLAAIVGLAVAGWLIFQQPAPPATARANPERVAERVVVPEKPAPPAVVSPPAPVAPADNLSEVVPPPPRPAKIDVAPKIATPQAVPTKKPKEPLHDPEARVALSLVGMDPDAEAYWAEAINDPNLPASERKDLIEDLNEEGFVDPYHLTLDDLPLIVNRIKTIEDHWPFAMDNANDDAFREAYKDLSNMYARLTQP